MDWPKWIGPNWTNQDGQDGIGQSWSLPVMGGVVLRFWSFHVATKSAMEEIWSGASDEMQKQWGWMLYMLCCSACDKFASGQCQEVIVESNKFAEEAGCIAFTVGTSRMQALDGAELAVGNAHSRREETCQSHRQDPRRASPSAQPG